MKAVESFLRIMLVTFIFLVWLLMIFFPVRTAFAAELLRLELGAGFAHHARRLDGLWYQNEYPNSHDLRTGAWQAGASWFTEGTPWRYGLRGAYVSLGSVSSSALVIEYEYDRFKELPCDRDTRHGNCFANLDQTTQVKGWSLGPLVERDLGKVVGSVEGGLFFGQSKVRAHVTPITLPGEFDVNNNWRFRTWYAGAGVRYQWLTLSYRWYQNLAASKGFFGPRHAYTVMLGISIPFNAGLQ
jgi:hypothetical protein